jgi:predicted benzoate:H+ symporter BenE
MLTVSDIALLGIGAPFWGLLAGVIVDSILRFRRASG